ncbi:SDR family NAD(P)-dependent oxidoreductase [Prauserella oleivorans]|uniref:SDR family NAD(P)-dependent oxidoreductase n=1 Tax=Prauserella oleivorans TaxID=1478153 RepID=A0ABW5WA18_9PSEU
MEISFAGRAVIVTGGAGGFGAATSIAFAKAGAHVVVSDINVEGAAAVAEKLPSAIAVRTDVTDADSMRELMDRTVDEYGRLDVLVNNAGMPHPLTSVVDMGSADIDQQVAINFRSVVLGCKYALPYLQKQQESSVVNVASISARRPRPGSTVYCATKAAVESFTRGFAAEVAPQVRVNAVSPVIAETGFVKSAFGVDSLPDDTRKSMVDGIPMGRTADVEDVANAILYLASSKATFLTGVCLDVDGGRSIS